MRTAGLPLLLVLFAAALTGCATGVPGAASPTAGPLPTAACPEQPGVELPSGCAPYDPEAAMALNELYRQRMELSEEATRKNEKLVAPVTEALESLRTADGGFTEEQVREALSAAGLASVQTRTGAGDVLFGAAGPGGGCLYGALEAERVSVDVGSYIMDGGCLPAQ